MQSLSAPSRVAAVRALVFATGMALPSAGCHSYKPLTTPGAAVSQMVRLQFSQPRDLLGRTATGTDSLLSGVSSLEGRVLAASADTLHVTITRITDSLGERLVTTSVAVTIIRDPSVAVDVLALDANRTAAFGGGALYALVLVTAIALVAALYAAGY